MAAKRLGSKFPVEHRPIYFQPAAKIVGGPQSVIDWGPKLLGAVNQIVAKYPGKRGIIHTHNFTIADLLVGKFQTVNFPKIINELRMEDYYFFDESYSWSIIINHHDFLIFIQK